MRKDYREHHRRRAQPFEGFEVWWHRAQMNAKMLFAILLISGALFWLLYWLYWVKTRDYLFFHNLRTWLLSFVWAHVTPGKEIPFLTNDGGVHFAPAREIYLAWRDFFLSEFGYAAEKGLRWFLLFEAVVMGFGIGYFRKKSAEVHRVDKVRGPELIQPKELNAELRKKYGKGKVVLTERVVLPKALENRHGFVVGTSGSGKSMFMKGLISHIRKQREKALVFDLKGEYVSIFYDPEEGDIIFNPLDRRTIPWRLISDLHDRKDVFDFARSFIPDLPGEGGVEKFFRDAAKDVFASILAVAKRKGLENAEIAGIVFSQIDRVARFLGDHPEGTTGYAYLSKTDSNQAAGIQATMMQFLRILEWFQGLDGSFSFREWIRKDGPGILFLPVPPAYRDLLAPAMTAVVNLLIRECLDMPDNLSRRRWFIVDEFGALNKLNSLVDGLTLGRSKGMCLFLGTQDFGRVDEKYGKAIRETLWNNAMTKLVLRVEAPDTAKYLSASLGETEVEIAGSETFSMGVEDYRDGLSLHRREQIKPLILYSEIQMLPDLEGFLRVGPFPPTRDRVVIRDLRPTTEEFVPREDVGVPAAGALQTTSGESAPKEEPEAEDREKDTLSY